MTDKLTKEEKAQKVQEIYDSAMGTDNYYRHALMRNFYWTDSVNDIATVAGAFWLIDAVVSHLGTNKKLQKEEFQVWYLKRMGEEWLLYCEDGNDHQLVQQVIEYSDFPVDEIHFYVEYGSVDGVHPAFVMLSPGDH